jgi:hypothetical protein
MQTIAVRPTGVKATKRNGPAVSEGPRKSS